MIFDVHEEPPVQHPLSLGSAGGKNGTIGTAMAMLREDVQSVGDWFCLRDRF